MKISEIGAIVGFSLSFVYLIFIMALQYLPMNNLLSRWIGILFALLLISLSSAIIGSITSVVFGWILKKFNNKSVIVFTITCLTLSFLAVIPFNLAYLHWVSNITYWDGHTLNARNDLFWIIVPPSIIYVITSGILSRYLYETNPSS